VFKNRVFRNIFRPKRDEMTDAGENCIMSNSRAGFTVVGAPGPMKIWRPLSVTTNLCKIAKT
jgi:hypothetical protein